MRGGFRRLRTSADLDTLSFNLKGSTDVRSAADPVAVRVTAAARARLASLRLGRVLRAAEPPHADGLVFRDHGRAEHHRNNRRRLDRSGDAAVPVTVAITSTRTIRTSPPALRVG